MSKRAWIRVGAKTLARMDRTELFLEGYPVPMASDFRPQVTSQDQATPVFGYSGDIYSRSVEGGQVSLTAYDHAEAMATVFDVLKGYDPSSAAVRCYQPDGNFIGHLVRATKHPTKSWYTKVEFFLDWNCMLGPAEGAVKSAGIRQLDGRCAVPIEISVANIESAGLAPISDIAAMTLNMGSTAFTGTLVSAPTLMAISGIEEYEGCFAVAVEIQKRDMANKIIKSARLSPTVAMVSSAGLVTITGDDLAGTSFGLTAGDITHAHVHAVKSIAAPTGSQLLCRGIDARGRWDTAS